MVLYNLLAVFVDFIHVLIIIFWVSGWFVSKDTYPTFRRFHSFFGVFLFPIQVLFSFRCPLVLLSGYLRQIAHSNNNLNFYNQPFVVRMLREYLGFRVPDICITIIILLGVGVAMCTLLTIKTKKALR